MLCNHITRYMWSLLRMFCARGPLHIIYIIITLHIIITYLYCDQVFLQVSLQLVARVNISLIPKTVIPTDISSCSSLPPPTTGKHHIAYMYVYTHIVHVLRHLEETFTINGYHCL